MKYAILNREDQVEVIDIPVREIFLSAAHYRAMEKEKGVAQTLRQLSTDIGLKRGHSTGPNTQTNDGTHVTFILGLRRPQYIRVDGEAEPVMREVFGNFAEAGKRQIDAKKACLDALLGYEATNAGDQKKHLMTYNLSFGGKPVALVTVTP